MPPPSTCGYMAPKTARGFGIGGGPALEIFRTASYDTHLNANKPSTKFIPAREAAL